MRLSTCDTQGICAATRAKDDMDGKIPPLLSLFLEKADMTVVTNLCRRLQTAKYAHTACDDRASGLLDLSRKCAAMFAALDSSSKRRSAVVRHLKSLLSPLSDMINNVKCVVR